MGSYYVLVVCERGYGKMTAIEEFPVSTRDGKGVTLTDVTERTGPVVSVIVVHHGHDVLLATDRGQSLRIRATEIRVTGRNAQGDPLMMLADGERVVSVCAF